MAGGGGTSFGILGRLVMVVLIFGIMAFAAVTVMVGGVIRFGVIRSGVVCEVAVSLFVLIVVILVTFKQFHL